MLAERDRISLPTSPERWRANWLRAGLLEISIYLIAPWRKTLRRAFDLSGAGKGNYSSKNFSLFRTLARNDDHSVGIGSAEKSDYGKRFGSSLGCDVQTGPRAWPIGAESAFREPFHCRQLFKFWLGELALRTPLNSI